MKFLVLVFLSIVCLVLDSYLAVYITFLVLSVFTCINCKKLERPLVFFVTFYLMIALLNISSWRGYTEVFTLKLYFFAFLCLCTPLMFNFKVNYDYKARLGRDVDFVLLGVAIHLFIVYVCVLYIYGTKGPVILNQALRFDIPTAIEYAIKSALPIAALVPVIKAKKHSFLVAALVLPAILMGYRGASVLALVSYLITLWYVNSCKAQLSAYVNSRNKTYYFLASICFLIVFIGFYLRRSGSSELATVDVLIDVYFDYNNPLLYLIIPFYLGFKETVGLSNKIITENISNSINDYPLFFADLFTILPGERLAAGQTLARLFGSVEGGGLTPGLLGGLYIDFGFYAFIFLVVMGIFFKFIVVLAYRNLIFIPVYTLLLTQYIHLFHRGFLKPEYITSLVIILFYFFMLNKVKIFKE
ncbi:hypothetical protein DS2_17200 [Catenovulum agarivorans DS-2]|uniref:Oligosaccharide repeat unit polymerase n=1 Tax=Catenovulum agarivorans DS-2 TaxID=1328313 RepID=W7Q904_9ALTE|nr:hypothetical protein [Catenovulum agarivorans]EWH08496.1 hypothetical protein DS2_17200 [Catenovulum agarivorans DS-2]